jgi:hypothetical protein
LYPGGLTGQIHTDGQIWATTLMRVYDIIGREKVDKAFLEGLGMTGSSTNQEDAAIAVRQAAIDMGYSCSDVDVFTQEFTATGYVMPPLPGLSSSVTNTICPGETVVVNGTTYDQNNLTGTEIITNGQGCDSTVTVNLTLTSINIGVVSTDPVLTSGQSGATYQWIDCDNNNAAIASETDQSFTATTNGTYAVIVTFSGCTDTSACVTVMGVGLEEFNASSISVYPNPSEGEINIVFENGESAFEYEITSLDGRLVKEGNDMYAQELQINIGNESEGVYFLKVNQENRTYLFKIILQ